MVTHKSNRTFPNFRGIPMSCWFRHDSILSREGASDNPGAIQRAIRLSSTRAVIERAGKCNVWIKLAHEARE
jgi:hypothetical protein